MSHARRVLVIDDEKVVCNSCRRVLEGEGFQVSVATDGRDGVERLSQENFDAVIVDLRMPGIGGMDVLRIIKRNKPDTRVLVITAYSSVTSAVEAMQLGAADYLPKPFTPKELTEKVSRILKPIQHLRRRKVKKESVSPQRTCVAEMAQVAVRALGEARVLLAGSDAEEMAALRQCLSSEPWRVTTAEEVGQVTEAIQAGQADVLITGLDVMGMKAYDLIPEVKKLGIDIPIIVACADASLDLARKIREFGIFFYLMEPFDPEEVRAAVRDAVRKKTMVSTQVRAAAAKATLVRSVQTVSRDGAKVGFVSIGGLIDENSGLYKEMIGELKRRSMPMHTEFGRHAVEAKEFPRYLEENHRVVLIAPLEKGAAGGEIVSYSASKFESQATEHQRRRLREVGYPEVMHWLGAQGITPEVRIVCLSDQYVAREQARRVASNIIEEGLS